MKRWIVYPWHQINEIGISAPSYRHLPRGTCRLFAAHCCVFLQSNTFHPDPSNFHLQISTLKTPFREPHHKYDCPATQTMAGTRSTMLVDCCVALDRLDGTHVTRFDHTLCTAPVSPYPHFFMSEVDFEVYRVLSPRKDIPTPSYAYPLRATPSPLAVGCCIILKSPSPPTVKPFFTPPQNCEFLGFASKITIPTHIPPAITTLYQWLVVMKSNLGAGGSLGVR